MLNDNQTLTVNFKNLLTHPLTPTYLKAAIYKAMSNTFVTLDEFMKELNESDLNSLYALYEKFFQGLATDEDIKTVSIIAISLAQLEGIFVEKDEDVEKFIKTVMVMVTSESLSRKGMIELNRSAMNFSASPTDILAKITQKGRDYYTSKKGDDVQDS